MAKTFRPWDVDQAWLLPASIHDFVPPEHPAHLVREIVRGELDLTPILSVYDEERGQPPYHPGGAPRRKLPPCNRGKPRRKHRGGRRFPS
jgi:hypothetical protein